MNKFLYAFITIMAFTSCAKSYYIQGTSNVSSLDGRKLYLKGGAADTLFTIDSCDVVHGEFTFKGNLDSVQIVQVYMDDVNLQFPLVLEEGDIILKLDNTQQSVSGTPLNDKINAFWRKFTQLRNQYVEIDHEEGVAIMNGHDEEATNTRLIKKALKVYANTDKLFTNFVTENFDNPLAPWGFLTRVTYDMTPNAYPIWMNDYLYMNAMSQLSSWVEYIMAKAPEHFKINSDVKSFYDYYQQAQSEMNGTAMPQESMQTPMAGTPQSNVSVPTPAQMAGDSAKMK
jgi:putative lipoprotein